jgi:hypothetical protein
MKQLSILEIESKIYYIRNQKVMLDSDLAELYGVTTFNLNKSVKRNSLRFPMDFMFQLTNQEVKDLIFQNGMSSSPKHGGRRHLPFVFNQEGVAMLSSVLRSEQAAEVNVFIMRTFVKLREMSVGYEDLSRKIEQLENQYDRQFTSVFDAIRELMSERSIPLKRIIGLGKK